MGRTPFLNFFSLVCFFLLFLPPPFFHESNLSLTISSEDGFTFQLLLPKHQLNHPVHCTEHQQCVYYNVLYFVRFHSETVSGHGSASQLNLITGTTNSLEHKRVLHRLEHSCKITVQIRPRYDVVTIVNLLLPLHTAAIISVPPELKAHPRTDLFTSCSMHLVYIPCPHLDSRKRIAYKKLERNCVIQTKYEYFPNFFNVHNSDFN